MKPRLALCALFAFAVVTIASAFASAPAMAHAGHSHAKANAAAPSAMEAALAVSAPAVAVVPDPASVEPEALADILNVADSSADPVSSASGERFGQQGQTNDSRGPCEGHCCAVSGAHCCGFAPPAAQYASCLTLAADLGAFPARDSVPDGLPPDSLLRPPKSFA